MTNVNKELQSTFKQTVTIPNPISDEAVKKVFDLEYLKWEKEYHLRFPDITREIWQREYAYWYFDHFYSIRVLIPKNYRGKAKGEFMRKMMIKSETLQDKRERMHKAGQLELGLEFKKTK